MSSLCPPYFAKLTNSYVFGKSAIDDLDNCKATKNAIAIFRILQIHVIRLIYKSQLIYVYALYKSRTAKKFFDNEF